ncbi:MAG: hypothetical protein K8R28_10790 [Desulfobacterales bacterium]|nr:hypothetical protein [Desulfobacterales bacterium]
MSRLVCVQRTGGRTETAYKAKFPGELAQHNKAQRFREYGKCCGCVAKVHALIRGDLSGMRPKELLKNG